ncbi:MAG TPA: fumarylacetoacetate hydrolase family protein [Pseudonocardia sp.]|nr:fumarylacetoacetate hydrolase family protein [Pseudonocardia sp.]
MRLATLRTPNGNRAVRVEGDTAIELGAPDVGALLALPDWRERAVARGRARHPLAEEALAPVVPRPGKIFCVGLNYRTHILEMGRELPEHPTLFAKFPEALVGPADPVALDPASAAVDWEAELAVVIGAPVRRADEAGAEGATVQSSDTADLVFDPVALVRYISRIVTLNPGDVIATGTPGGVGHARTPPRYLTDGSVLVTEIDGIGRLSNVARAITAAAV